MKTRIILFFISIILFSCKNSNIPDDIEWAIVNEDINQNTNKNSIDVNLNKKIHENTIREIAEEIRSDRKDYNSLYIRFFIPETEIGASWATANYDPNLEVEIFGSTIEEDLKLEKSSGASGKVLGKWKCNKSLMGAILILHKDGSILKMKINFKDGTSLDSDITEKKKAGKDILFDNNGHEEYYIIESNGNLGMYGKDGKFDEAIKIK